MIHHTLVLHNAHSLCGTKGVEREAEGHVGEKDFGMVEERKEEGEEKFAIVNGRWNGGGGGGG